MLRQGVHSGYGSDVIAKIAASSEENGFDSAQALPSARSWHSWYP